MGLNLLREVIHELLRVFRSQQQLPLVGLRHAMTFEAILENKNKYVVCPCLNLQHSQSWRVLIIIRILFLKHSTCFVSDISWRLHRKQLNSATAYTTWLFLLTRQARNKTLPAAKSLLINCERDYETWRSRSHLCPLWKRIDVAPPRSTQEPSRHQKYLLGWCPGRCQAIDWDRLTTSGPGLKTSELHEMHPQRQCLSTSFFLSNIKSFITVWLNL